MQPGQISSSPLAASQYLPMRRLPGGGTLFGEGVVMRKYAFSFVALFRARRVNGGSR
jgi:hypothetical protein